MSMKTTLRQQKAITELVANGGSVASAMRKAGYSARTARNPKKLTETRVYKDAVEPIVEALESERWAIFEQMQKTRSRANYGTLVHGLDVVSKQIQLLRGKPTGIQFGAHVELTDAEKKKIEMLFRDIGTPTPYLFLIEPRLPNRRRC
jgi:hypothetical protein